MLDPKSPVQMSKPVTLQDISYRDFHAIVSKITSYPNWRLIPDLIELSSEQQGSRFSYEAFAAKHTQYQSDEERGRAMLKEYRSWGVSIEALVHVLKNSTVSMDEAAEFVQSKNFKPTVTSAYPETMSQIFNPPPVSYYRTTNKMVIVPDDDELNRRCEEFLKEMAYELLFDHGTHQFWELSFGHVPAILVKARLSKSDAICSALVAQRVVTDVSFLLKADCYGQLTQESALERMRMDGFWSVVVHRYLDTKKFDVQFFGVSDQDMIKDVDLMCWLVKPITESPAVCINFGLKDDGMPIDTATVKTAAALERCDLCHTKQARSLSSSTSVYYYGPAMLAWIVTLKLKLIIEELQKEGLELVTVYEVSIDEVADLMFQPQNATLRDDMMEILCQMESDGVPKIPRGDSYGPNKILYSATKASLMLQSSLSLISDTQS